MSGWGPGWGRGTGSGREWTPDGHDFGSHPHHPWLYLTPGYPLDYWLFPPGYGNYPLESHDYPLTSTGPLGYGPGSLPTSLPRRYLGAGQPLHSLLKWTHLFRRSVLRRPLTSHVH